MRPFIVAALLLALSACADPDVAAKLAYEQCIAAHTSDWVNLKPEVHSAMCSGDAQNASWAAEERQRQQVEAIAAVSAAAAASAPQPPPVYIQPAFMPPAIRTTNCTSLVPGSVSCTTY